MPVLTSVQEYSPETLGAEISYLIAQRGSRKYLKSRYSSGVISRHGGSAKLSIENMTTVIQQDRVRRLRAFAVAGPVSGAIFGMATIYPKLPLYHQRTRFLPARAARDLGFSDELNLGVLGANVNAWVAGAGEAMAEELTGLAYKELATVCLGDKAIDPVTVWTIEPENAADYIHSSIKRAGFVEADHERYDVMESGLRVPPVSVLYVLDPPSGS